MGTSYHQIYNRFLNKITDFDLPAMDDTELANYCLKFMQSAILKIRTLSNDLSARNDLTMEFDNELEEIEIEIISCLMVAEWVNQKLYNTQLTVMFLGTKDEKFNSQANMITALKTLRDDMVASAHTLRRDWKYQHDDYMSYE